MGHNQIRWLPLVVVALSFAIVGCYTILKHPVTSQEGPQSASGESHPQEYYRQNCIECHADYAEFPYGYFYGDYPDYYFQYPRWGYYYAYPWWWDNHWYDTGDDEEGNPIFDSEKASRRGSLIPPYVTGAPAVNTGNHTRGGYVVPNTPNGDVRGSKGVGSDVTAPGSAARTEKTKVAVPGSAKGDASSNDSTTVNRTTTSKKAPRIGGPPN